MPHNRYAGFARQEPLAERGAPQPAEETRSFSELRSEGSGRKIVGYPILFNSNSQDLGGFVERIAPDAVQFDSDVRADFNHDANMILGRVSAGTLRLSVDSRGVRMEADAPNTTWANDLLESIRRGDINQGSFAFRVMPGGESEREENGQTVRTLTKILVRKVSVVSDPAYTKTAIEVRKTPPGFVDPSVTLARMRLDLEMAMIPESSRLVSPDLARMRAELDARMAACPAPVDDGILEAYRRSFALTELE